jgi:UDPglucose--hexose-1-phosphate uridylyltransferase
MTLGTFGTKLTGCKLVAFGVKHNAEGQALFLTLSKTSNRKAKIMAELRLDPVAHRWVVTGKRRVMADFNDAEAVCPFCPGNEHFTPPSIEELRDAKGTWTARVFHDRAPIFLVEGGEDRRAVGMFDRMNPVGAHEIVVETPQHGVTLAHLPVDQISKCIALYRDRILDLKRDIRLRYVSVFKDQGPKARNEHGHSHSQVLASPVLPQFLEIEFRWSKLHFERRERCLFCDCIQQEMDEGKRVVDQNADFIAVCPFASRSPYELWVLPIQHSSSFEKDLTETARVISLASFLKPCLQRIENISAILHFVIHTEPNLEAHKPTREWWSTVPDDFHWHIELHPDVEGERRYLGSEGFYFNPIPAEEAALVLRALEPEAEAAPPAP